MNGAAVASGCAVEGTMPLPKIIDGSSISLPSLKGFLNSICCFFIIEDCRIIAVNYAEW